MIKKAWRDFIKCLILLYDITTALSKLNSAKNVSKLKEFESLYGSKWGILMELHMKEYKKTITW